MRALMRFVAEKIIARRYPMPKEDHYDPNTLPNLSDRIRLARKRLTEIDRNLEIFRVARQTSLIKQFEIRHVSESSEKRAECAFFYMREHKGFRSIVENLRKPMEDSIESIQAAIEFLRDVSGGEAKGNVLKELLGRIDYLMPFGDMVKHPWSMDFYRKDLLDLSNQLNALKGENGKSKKGRQFTVVDGDGKRRN